MSEHGGKNLVFVNENKVIVAWTDLFRIKVKRTPMVVFFLFGVFVQVKFLNITRSLVVQRVFLYKNFGQPCV